MSHNPVGILLTGPLTGTLALPQFSADAHIAKSAFGPRSTYNTLVQYPLVLNEDARLVNMMRALTPHITASLDVRAGANITVTRDALGFVVAGSAGAAASMDEVRAFVHVPTVPEIVAGANITVTRDARGYTIAGSAGGSGATLDEVRAFNHPTNISKEITAGTNIAIAQDALGETVSLANPVTALKLAAGTSTANTQPIELTSGTLLATTEAGSVEFDGKAFYTTPVVGDRGISPSILRRVLLANATGTDVATAQPWFPSNGAVAVRASTCYKFRGAFSSVRTAGTTSHTTNILFGGTATLTAIGYFVEVKEGDAATISDSDLIAIQVATSTNIKAASVSASENIVFEVQGHVWINAAGTFIPQFIYSAAPGQAPTIEIGTFFELYPIGDNAVTTIGTWT